jgi:hypothetical protein
LGFFLGLAALDDADTGQVRLGVIDDKGAPEM